MTVARIHHPFDESFARDTIGDLRAAGWTDAIRYGVGPGKAITRAEWDAFIAAGMTVTLVDEGGAQQAMGGYWAGVTRAAAMMTVLDSMALPRDPSAGCYYVGDDPVPVAPGAYPTVAAFFRGVRDVHAAHGGRWIGDYGSGQQINATRHAVPEVTREWPVRTWGLSSHPDLIQEPNPTMDTLGGTIDQNTAVTDDWGQWPSPSHGTPDTQAPDPTPTAAPLPVRPPLEEGRMKITDQIVANQLDTFHVDDAGRLVHHYYAAPGPWQAEALPGRCVPLGEVGLLKWAHDGNWHVVAEGPKGGQVHCWWNGSTWGSDSQNAPA